MIEEASSKKEYSMDEVPCIEDLLVKHFGKIEESIRSADSHESALEIVEMAISNFRRECISETLLEFLKYDMKAMVEKYWKTAQYNLAGK
jgi:hypothetical protein